jgi:hypothetical protein
MSKTSCFARLGWKMDKTQFVVPSKDDGRTARGFGSTFMSIDTLIPTMLWVIEMTIPSREVTPMSDIGVQGTVTHTFQLWKFRWVYIAFFNGNHSPTSASKCCTQPVSLFWLLQGVCYDQKPFTLSHCWRAIKDSPYSLCLTQKRWRAWFIPRKKGANDKSVMDLVESTPRMRNRASRPRGAQNLQARCINTCIAGDFKGVDHQERGVQCQEGRAETRGERGMNEEVSWGIKREAHS